MKTHIYLDAGRARMFPCLIYYTTSWGRNYQRSSKVATGFGGGSATDSGTLAAKGVADMHSRVGSDTPASALRCTHEKRSP